MRHPSVAAVLTPLLTAGQLASCGVLELEVLYSARSHRDFLDTLQELRSLPRLPVTQSDFDRAVDIMERLARRGQHRSAGLPDLLLAAIAERYGVVLLHYDADFDTIAAITGQPMRWVMPSGTVP